MTNKFVSAYMKVIGKKGGKSSADKRRGNSDYYKDLAKKRWEKRKSPEKI
tara:strand:+ start:656 stop:805 length:150 start_codon:yes stop_codon:yes gene_type:complete